MSFYTLFWILCAVLSAHVIVAVIAVARAFRAQRRRPFALGGYW
jgi:hypothetical protein